MNSRSIKKKFIALREEALKEVITEARKIMSKHPHLDEFLMAMGTAYFIDKQGEIVDLQESYMTASYDYRMRDNRSYFKTLNNFLNEWNDSFSLTGEGIRFKATGKIVTDW